MALSPEALAKRFDKWAEQGLDYALVVGAQSAMELDRAESIARIHSKSGTLASTVRLTTPSATRTRRKGYFTISLAAGSKSKTKPVAYAGVLQEGKTFGGATRTKGHWIPRQPIGGRLFGGLLVAVGAGHGVKLPGGAVRRAVWHPGSRLVKQEYLRINEGRAKVKIDASIQKNANTEIGG